MIRAVVFDWGGVIQRTTDARPREELAAALGLTRPALETAVFESAVWSAASRGGLSAEETWGAIARAVGWPAERVNCLVEKFFAGDRVDEDLLRLIRGLRAGGVPVALLSNAPPSRAGSASQAGRWGMDGLFDVQVFSYEVGELKPHLATYQRVLKALGVPAEEALFIDDAPANITGARSAGMGALLFTGTRALYEELRRRGLPVPGQPAPGQRPSA